MELTVGQIINAPFLPCPAEIKGVSERTGYTRLEAVLTDGSNQYLIKNLTASQLSQIEIIQQNVFSRLENAEDFFFYIEAHRIRLAYQFDPHLAVSISQIDPLPHQIEAVYHHVLNSPRIRFLIADDPGAGKTIMAGLVLKELQYRKLAQRILIVAPGHLKYQWQREMKERFQTTFAIVDRARIESTWGENVWEERDRLITSIDFIKQDDVQNTLRATHWDLIIVDEAHKMSAYAYQGRERTRIDKTKRYRVGELLSGTTNHLLFLTATPHRGDDENFRLFLDLLRPGFFAQTELLRESVANKDNPIFIRRLKEDMKTFDGRAIFPPRHVSSVRFHLTAPERELYNNVTEYVRDYFDRAKENRSIAFALMILQRRLTSSSFAIFRSLQRRKQRLEELLDLPDQIQKDEDYLRARGLTEDDLAEMAEEERLEWEERLEHLTLADNIEEVEAEIDQLEVLVVQADAVRQLETESKLVALRDQVLAQLGDRKLLIFTEFRDTVNYLIEKLQAWGYDVITIHGQMNMDARIAAEHEFKNRAQIMVATEAAGEGINLQFCSWMVNYDIPWNPNRLEQRMGRIHRYGQQYEVFIYNLISQDTREGQILDRLFEKLDKMRLALGSDRVFDIIGDLIPGVQLDDLLKDAVFSQRRMEEIEQHIDDISVAEARQTLERAFMTSLATRHIDYSGVLREKLEAEENRLVPEYIEDYFLRAYNRLGGRLSGRSEEGSYRTELVPFELRRWNEDYHFKTDYGQVFRQYNQLTFDKNIARRLSGAEFVAPGHPLLEAINEEVLTQMNCRPDSYALFGDPDGQQQGALWFIQGEVSDGSGEAAGKRVFCLYQPLEGAIQVINPAVLWDLQPLEADELPRADLTSMLSQQEFVDDFLITQVLFPFQEEIATRRKQETEVKEKYGLRSLDYLIQESNQKILDYQMRQAGGESIDLPLLNEQRNLEQLQLRKQQLVEEIRLERHLTVGDPHLLGVALVMPWAQAKKPSVATPGQIKETPDPEDEYKTSTDDPGYDSDRRREIELVGMHVAMEYERQQGWKPEDVSGENHGFDIRSLRYEDGVLADIRYVEVKARSQTGAIRLSANEWKKARRYGNEYWLYIVTSAGGHKPALQRIQSPDSLFALEQNIFATGYIIPEERWREKVS